jgi:hypothetical protein
MGGMIRMVALCLFRLGAITISQAERGGQEFIKRKSGGEKSEI